MNRDYWLCNSSYIDQAILFNLNYDQLQLTIIPFSRLLRVHLKYK